MYTMAPEDYYRLQTDDEHRRARGWKPATAKVTGRGAHTKSGWLRWLRAAPRSAPLNS